MLITLRPATLVRLVLGAATTGAVVAVLTMGGSPTVDPTVVTPPGVSTTAEVPPLTQLLW
ncbi:hypothetical protein ACFQV2_20825 [Actinokineospora soli]|uniref:Uncharacterized protein n=1 Tax=Actinokineospora soli TaxID=1048753 RepID=A0ABW2TS25_9PSEU